MELYFKHKKTGQKVSLEDIKQTRGDTFRIGSRTRTGIRQYMYNMFEIPFSDDFEPICVDQEFSIEELKEIEYSLNLNPFISGDELRSKVRDMIISKIQEDYNKQ